LLNRMDIIGRFGADPEQRTTTNGYTYARFSLPLFHGFNVKERKTEWIQVEAWNQLGDIVMSKGKKGKLVHIEGELSIDSWETDGERKSRTYIRIRSIKFLDKAEDNASASAYAEGQSKPVYKPTPQTSTQPQAQPQQVIQPQVQAQSQPVDLKPPIEEDELEALFGD
jgi:single-strand DNA-binding protein